jgi:pSer/pThr/pTyr-binding forkhead associated (FHA) protein
MDPHVTLSVVEGKLNATRYNVDSCGRFVLGRGSDCDIALKGDDLVSLSRHHCLLIVEQASVSLRDLGSRNGTYVNGNCIGCRLDEEPSSILDSDSYFAVEVNDGDEIGIGHVVFRLGIDSFAEKNRSPLKEDSSHVQSTV